MSTPTVIATLRKNLREAIEAIFRDPAVLEAVGGVAPNIYEGKTSKGWFLMSLPGTEGIVIAYDALSLKARGPVGKRKDRLQHRFTLAITSGNWNVPVTATYTAADVAEYLRGSPTLPEGTPALRDVAIGNINGDDIYLRFVSETAEMAPNSTVQGGRVALLQVWETFPEVPQ